MMDEDIKFRATIEGKTRNEGNFTVVYFTLGDLADPDRLFSLRELVVPWLMAGNKADRYTGRKDEDDTEIYDGDIIECLETVVGAIQKGERGKVVWNGVGFTAVSLPPHDWDPMSPTFAFEHVKVKVIGNIYENPELLEASV